ncbi:hypothetical protein [Hafnia sp. CBA7124]|uniref:hypothetical protein n=1 Tax=Hafnia sp. CBA7124 TaxID=1848580 RepID=UPI000BBAAE66|nr:hypothetical protein [Hafnia sp. CBA7124]
MIHIVKNNFLLTEYVLKDLNSKDIHLHSMDEFVDLSKSNSKKLFLRIYYRLIVFFLFSVYGILFFFKKNKRGCVIYYGIDQFNLLALIFKKCLKYKKQSLWLWNPCSSIARTTIELRIIFFIMKFIGIKIWTFDKDDASKFGLFYHHQIYSQKIVDEYAINKEKSIYSGFFVGKNKGRIDKVKIISEIFINSNLKFFHHITRDHINNFSDAVVKDCMLKDEDIAYSDYLDILINSECIVEIIQKGQSGLTLRALESLFFGKKLITDNTDISCYDFYHKNNILIIEKEMITTRILTGFMRLPYVEISREIKEKYTINSLINTLAK